MQKILYRSIILALIFVLSLGFFVAIMKENSLTRAIETMDMSEASLPVVTAVSGKDEINPMYGYVKDMFPMGAREEITPIGADGMLRFNLYHYGNDISSVEYEINNRIERIVIATGEGTMEQSEEGEKSSLTLKIPYRFSQEVEYGLKLILVNRDGKKIYYYTTLKYLKENKFFENVKFVKKLEKAIFTKKDPGFLKQYLESNNSMDNMSFAHITIHSSYDLVTWGDLKPVKVTEPKISVLEHNAGTTALMYKYVASVGEENKNFYYVTEFYRVNTIEKAHYLLAYDRKVEEVFSPEKTSLSKSQLKMGVGNKKINFLFNKSKTFISFVKERELWQYDVAQNRLNKIFSYRQDEFVHERELLDRHKVKLLYADENGDLYFAVYGYMNRGAYEGKNGLVIYKFFEEDKRMEEQVYIPVDKLYKELIHEIDKVSHLSENGFFYFSIDGRLYSYSLVKRKIDVISENAKKDTYFQLKGGEEIVWQESEGEEEIKILNLESRSQMTIPKEAGKRLNLFSILEDHIIYGVADKKDVRTNTDGSLLIPNEKVVIADANGNKLKEYSQKGRYVVDIRIQDTIISLVRLKKSGNEFVPEEEDQILNNFSKKVEEISPVDRITEKYLTEYYLKLPKNVVLKELPKTFKEVKSTVILSETTAKLPESKEPSTHYYAVIYGGIVASSEKPAPMINLASQGMGYVLDHSSATVWERGRTRLSGKSEEIDLDFAEATDTEKEAAVRLYLTASGIYISDKELKADSSVLEVLKKQSEIKIVDLTGVSLEDVLYYISGGHPVIAMAGDRIVLITEYSIKTITVMDVKTGKTEVISKEEAEVLFKNSGNRFISSIG